MTSTKHFASITYSVLISPCFALDPNEIQQRIKPEFVIEVSFPQCGTHNQGNINIKLDFVCRDLYLISILVKED